MGGIVLDLRSAPYEGKGAGHDGKGFAKGLGKAGTIQGMIDCLINEGLPGGNFKHDAPGTALYLANLPHDTTEEDLYTIFATFGAIPPRGVKVMPGMPGQRTYGFCNFINPAHAEFAMM